MTYHNYCSRTAFPHPVCLMINHIQDWGNLRRVSLAFMALQHQVLMVYDLLISKNSWSKSQNSQNQLSISNQPEKPPTKINHQKSSARKSVSQKKSPSISQKKPPKIPKPQICEIFAPTSSDSYWFIWQSISTERMDRAKRAPRGSILAGFLNGISYRGSSHNCNWLVA